MSDHPSVSRRSFLTSASKAIMFAAIVPLVGCGGNSGGDKKNTGKPGTNENASAPSGTGPAPDSPAMPAGVIHDPSNVKHTPQCTVTKDGSTLVIAVVVPHVVNAQHYISGVKFFSPGPAFSEVAAHTLDAAQIEAANASTWEHTFRIDTAQLPAGCDHLLAVSYCNLHGEYGASSSI